MQLPLLISPFFHSKAIFLSNPKFFFRFYPSMIGEIHFLALPTVVGSPKYFSCISKLFEHINSNTIWVQIQCLSYEKVLLLYLEVLCKETNKYLFVRLIAFLEPPSKVLLKICTKKVILKKKKCIESFYMTTHCWKYNSFNQLK